MTYFYHLQRCLHYVLIRVIGGLLLAFFVLQHALAAPSPQDAVRLLIQQDRLEAALQLAKRHLQPEQHGSDTELLFLTGLIYARIGELDSAEQVFSSLIAAYPELPEPYNNLAAVYAASGALDKAAQTLKQAINIHPDYAIARQNLADVYTRMAGLAQHQAAMLDLDNVAANKKHSSTNVVPAIPADAVATETEQDSAAIDDAIIATIHGWASSWSAQAFETYLSFYASDFIASDALSRPAWEAQRKKRILGPQFINVDVQDITISVLADGRAEAQFIQKYQSDRYSDQVTKRFSLQYQYGRWQIIEEHVVTE